MAGFDEAAVRNALKASEPLEEHIRFTWPKLRRSLKDVYLTAYADPKAPTPEDNTYMLYISAKEDMGRVEQELKDARRSALRKIRAGSAQGPQGGLPVIKVKRLPKDGFDESERHGLLYLPHAYIVPGVRFNEMYNWDSMFIASGLIESKRLDDAKWLVDNLLYEADHYGTVLNGNRTYYMGKDKGRSQPPLVTDKILKLFDNWDKLKHAKNDETDVQWLTHTAASLEGYYNHWITAPHLHESGLSQYASNNTTPSAEVPFCEPGHYEGALKLLTGMLERQTRRDPGKPLTPNDREESYYIEQYLTIPKDGSAPKLSEKFYQGDSAMRESGFDPCLRFGHYNIDIINHLPVCINSLRYKMEKEMSDIYERLAQRDPAHEDTWKNSKAKWEQRAVVTKSLMNRLLWDEGVEGQREPAYRDRNINTAMQQKYGIAEFKDYPFATALYPIWTGVANDEQAAKIVKYILPKLKTPNGLRTSDHENTGCHWDNMIWAPMNKIAVEALESKGYNKEALEIATGFLNMVAGDFERTKALTGKGKLFEKYSVQGSSDICHSIDKGYSVNDEGFGWTNAAVIEMRAAVKRISQKMRKELPLSSRIKASKSADAVSQVN